MAVILFAIQVFLPAVLSAWNVLLKPPPRLRYEALCFPDLSQVIHMHVKVWEALYRFQDLEVQAWRRQLGRPGLAAGC